MRLRAKKWAEPFIEEHKDFVVNEEQINEIIHNANYIEIGSGCGDFLLGLASNNTQFNFLGIEKFFTAYLLALKKYVSIGKYDNLNFLNKDIDEVFEQIQNESLDGIFLNFSDPWPKVKHHKRRLTFPTRLNKYYELLKKGGKVYFKTDNDLLFADTLEYIKETPFKLVFETTEYDGKDAFDSMSEYEKKFRESNKNINKLVLVKE